MSDKLVHNPFAALAGMKGVPPPAPAAPDPSAAAPAASRPAAVSRAAVPPPGSPKRPAGATIVETTFAPGTKVIPRAVVRLERTGRGGKEVTVVDHLALSPAEREDWLKALKAALGCGGNIAGDTLVLQGDQRDRLAKVLAARGVRKITVG